MSSSQSRPTGISEKAFVEVLCTVGAADLLDRLLFCDAMLAGYGTAFDAGNSWPMLWRLEASEAFEGFFPTTAAEGSCCGGTGGRGCFSRKLCPRGLPRAGILGLRSDCGDEALDGLC